jgi:L-ascorbate metabolism protein UlaG (beta-lactamase superfamily)
MELQYYGANCVRITTKKASVIVDDNLAELGASSVAKPGEIVLYTADHKAPPKDIKLMIDQPGEYEVANISIVGVAARAHMDVEGKTTATMFKLVCDDVRLVVVGHIYPELNDNQLEALGTVDVLVIPIGGNGYTLDPVGALKVIKKIEPKLIIPTHYADAKLTYPMPQQELKDALKAMSMEPGEAVAKLKLKDSDFGEDTKVTVLERQG